MKSSFLGWPVTVGLLFWPVNISGKISLTHKNDFPILSHRKNLIKFYGNNKLLQLIGHLFEWESEPLVKLENAHAIQFEKWGEVVTETINFIKNGDTQ
jgi:hypothetical protein